MKKAISFFLLFCIPILSFGCQSVSETSAVSSESSESSAETTVECVSWAPMAFESTEDLINYLKGCRNVTYTQDVCIQNFIDNGIVTLYMPAFTPPEGYRLSGIELHYANCTYYYDTEELINSHEQKMSSQFAAASAAAQSRSYPISSYETMVDSSALSGEPQTSSEAAILQAQQKAEEKFLAENQITIQWCTEKSEDPLAWVIENYSLKPLGSSENPKYYYKEQIRYNEIWAYDVYWSMDGYRCYAYLPAALFSEESVAEICSLTPVSASCYD